MLLSASRSALLLVLLLAGCNNPFNPAAQTPKASPTPPPPPTVTVVTVQPQPVPVTVELPGRTTAYLAAELRPQVTGLLKERLFKEGSEVKAGQMLYAIEAAPYQAAYESARALLSRAEANLSIARLKAERNRELLKLQAISTQTNDEAQATEKQAQADVAVAKAALEKTQIDLNFTRLTAPIAGRIGRSAVTVGSLVTAHQPTALATIQQIDPIYVDLTQSSSEMLRLKRELESGKLQRPDSKKVVVQLLLEEGVRYGHRGELAFSEVSVDPATGSVTLRALFPNPEGLLLPGMYVRAQIVEGVNEGAILLPHAAVSYTPRGQPQVLIVNSEQKVEVRPIQTRESLSGQWVVTSGLTAGERVITEGVQKARPGSVVNPQAPPNPPAANATTQP